ncbi:MAG: membrane integrity-associated transporter subunit PqiC [Gammaproteobacteria bacterium]|nr:membrane integrity-associated transporter subunit PqiC [Gammaproteobacteria bacterium]
MRRPSFVSRHSWLAGYILLASGIALIAACTSLQPVKSPSLTTFALDPGPSSASVSGAGALTIAVSVPRAMPGFDTPRMAYVNKPPELAYFSKNQWVDAPARMIAPHLVRALEHNGRFRAVVGLPSSVAADLRLDTELMRLQQDFTTTPGRMRFTLRAQVIDVAAGKVLGAREFDVTEQAPSDDPHGGAIAANRALASILASLAEFCGDIAAEKRQDASSAQR